MKKSDLNAIKTSIVRQPILRRRRKDIIIVANRRSLAEDLNGYQHWDKNV